MPNKKYAVPMIITALLAAIFLPIVFMGYFTLNQAESEFATQNYASAAESFKQAAKLLPWRNDLWEKTGIAAARNGDQNKAIGFF